MQHISTIICFYFTPLPFRCGPCMCMALLGWLGWNWMLLTTVQVSKRLISSSQCREQEWGWVSVSSASAHLEARSNTLGWHSLSLGKVIARRLPQVDLQAPLLSLYFSATKPLRSMGLRIAVWGGVLSGAQFNMKYKTNPSENPGQNPVICMSPFKIEVLPVLPGLSPGFLPAAAGLHVALFFWRLIF